MSDIQDNEPKWLPPCSECAECNGRGGRWDEEAVDQWYWCHHCDAAEKEAMSDTPRTDAAKNRRGIEGDAWIRADFARELERELNSATADLVVMQIAGWL